jgi:adenylate cyclase
MCREFNAEVISSAELVAKLCLPGHYAARSLGSIKLRGKEKEVLLSALQPVIA